MATLLVLTVLLPLLGSVILFLSPWLEHKAARTFALGTTLATMALTLILVIAFQADARGPQFAIASSGGYGWAWIDPPNIRFAVGLDGISLWLFALTSLLMITSVCSSWESITERAPTHYALMLALQTGLLGLFASLDVV